MPTARVMVELPGRPDCAVRIGTSLLGRVGSDLAKQHPDISRAVLLSDQQAGALFRPAIKTSLAQAGFRVLDITVPDGRAARTAACAQELWTAFAQSDIGTDTVLVALGGLDACVAGLYTAAGYRGGMCAALVPATPEAMATVSTLPTAAVDLPDASATATATPMVSCAWLSLDLLVSAGAVEREAGAAEIVRAAMLGLNDELFRLEDLVPGIQRMEGENLGSAFALANVARADALALASPLPPPDAAARGFSYGSSLRRAVASCGRDTAASRGHLLADGMRFEARLGVACGVTPLELMQEQDALLANLGFPPVSGLPCPEDLAAALSDLPGQPDDAVRLALPADAGAFAVTDIDAGLVLEHLQARAASI
jgi:3-dehydroquinate synthase